MFNRKKIQELEKKINYLTHIVENPFKFKKGDELFYLNESNEFKKVIITNGYVKIIFNEKEYKYINYYFDYSSVSRCSYYGYYAEDKLFTKEQLKKI